jgi:diguanylate cyclase (GGDEF)-like protein
MLAKELRFQEKECRRIAFGGLIHDIGKLNVDPKILYKPEKLNAREYLLMQRHPVIGETLIHDSKHSTEIMDAVLYHHERYDGTGYCKNLKAGDIPLEARIVCICDSFDAMVSYRSYKKKALTVKQAKRELQTNKNKQFDGELVDHFLKIVDDIYEQHILNGDGEHDDQACPFTESNSLLESVPNTDINWRRILNRLPHTGVLYIDKNDTIRYANFYFKEIRNIESDILGINFLDFHRPHRREILKNKLSKLRSGEINGWKRLMAIKGKYIENRYTRIADKNGNYDGFLVTTQDVSKREELLRNLEKNIERSNILVQANKLLTDIRNLDDAMENVTNLVRQVIPMEHINIVILKYMDNYYYNIGKINGFTKKIKRFVADNISSIFENLPDGIQAETVDGKLIIQIPLKFKHSNSGCIFIQTKEQVSFEAREMELLEAIGNHTASAIQNHLFFVEINEMAIRDNLTGIYNRQYFQKKLETLDTDNQTFTFIMSDIDGLKYVNDNLSHIMGDWLIMKAAEVIKKSIRSTDLAFRYGGDEFVILMYNAQTKDVENILKRINNNIARCESLKEGIKLSMSLGYAMSSHLAKIGDTLLLADKNMYLHKNKQKMKQNRRSNNVTR